MKVTDSPRDLCECGDYREQHHDGGTGRCKFLTHGIPRGKRADGSWLDECPAFRLSALVASASSEPRWRKEGGVTTSGNCGARYYYGETGWLVEHCGHPTANFRYVIHSPAGFRYLAPNGRAFVHLKDAKAEVERLETLGREVRA